MIRKLKLSICDKWRIDIETFCEKYDKATTLYILDYESRGSCKYFLEHNITPEQVENAVQFFHKNNNKYYCITTIGFYIDNCNCKTLLTMSSKELSLRHKEYKDFYGKVGECEDIVENFYFLTLTGRKRIPDTDENIVSMTKFSEALFNNDRYKRYHRVRWNIETGKHKDNPNLHLHAVIEFETGSKNFHSLKIKGRSDLRILWNKYFEQYGLDTGKDSFQYFRGKKIMTIYQDKVDYLIEEKKSDLHQNYRNLGLNFDIS